MRNRLPLMLIACCLLLWQTVAHAQMPSIPRMRLLGAQEGLPSNSVQDIARDRHGFIWFATTDGLARYDTAGMQVWRQEDGLPGSSINRVHVDAQDRVWVTVSGHGVAMLDAARRKWTVYNRSTLPGFEDQSIYAISSQGSDIWLGTSEKGLYRLDAAGKLHVIAGSKNGAVDTASLPSSTVISLAPSSDGSLWIGTVAGLARLRGGRIEQLPLPGENPTPLIYTVHATGRGAWIGAGSGVYYLDADGKWHTPFWSPMFQRPNAALRIVMDRAGEIWIGSQKRLWHVMRGQAPTPVMSEERPLERLVTGVMMEPGGAIWAGLPDAGVGYLRPDWRNIAELRYASGPGGLAGATYRGVAIAADRRIWLAGDDGDIERLDPDGRLSRVPDETRLKLAGTHPFSILAAADGSLWIGERRGLLRLDRHWRLQRWPADGSKDAPPGDTLQRLRQASDGTVWLLSPDAGLQQRAANGAVLRTLAVSGDALSGLELDAMGTPWILKEGVGLVRLDEAGELQPVAGIHGADVLSFAFDAQGRLWLHRRTGFERYAYQGGIWKRDAAMVAGRDSLPVLESSSLKVDPLGRAWLATRRGLLRWDPRTNRLHHVGIEHGLQSQDFFNSGDAMAMGSDGRLVASTQGGTVVVVDTTAADPAPQLPIFSSPVLEARRAGHWAVLEGTEPTLDPNDRELRVRVRLLAFENPAGNSYWSRLEGHENDWVEQGAQGDRVLAGLAPGAYQLRFRARDALGNAAAEQTVRFRVPQPWWATAWARAGYVLAALALVAFGMLAWRRRERAAMAMREAEQRSALAEEASLAKTRFLATLGHEIRTPMTGVLGMSELLESTPLDAQQRGQVRTIRRAGEHLLQLVDDALDLARIEAGRMELADAPFNLRTLIDDIAQWARPNAQRKGLAFLVEVDSGVPQILRGDAVRVRQVLLNLLGNAIKFTEQGSVSLRVVHGEPWGVVAEVRDTGPGMSAEQQTRLFRRFEQAEGQRTTARYGGSGLGLAISQELSQAMGGVIEVESAVGEGAYFRVTLPLPEAETSASPVEPAIAVSTDRPAPLRLLMVEDDLTIAEVIAGLLQAQGHSVIHASHALAALTEVASQPFDAALLDLDLPGMDGFELAGLLRAQGSSMKLLAVTARADGEAEELAREAGFDDFLRKPVTTERLSRALNQLLAGDGVA